MKERANAIYPYFLKNGGINNLIANTYVQQQVQTSDNLHF